MASRMFSKDGYLPVPTMRRDLNSLPPSHSDVSYMVTSSCSSPVCSATTHRTDDLDLVAVLQDRVGVVGFRSDLAVHGHRGVLAAHAELGEESVDGEALGQLHRLAV